mmetsp:Transcript_11169/g.47666  ORF Transcript_11169/g.47666 Transcript_11169/m.47666 type:complete len:298 (+) Transcript_11169:491-1384(+)
MPAPPRSPTLYLVSRRCLLLVRRVRKPGAERERVSLRHPVFLPHLVVLERRVQQLGAVPPAGRVHVVQEVRRAGVHHVVRHHDGVRRDEPRVFELDQVRQIALLAVIEKHHVRGHTFAQLAHDVRHALCARALQDLDAVGDAGVRRQRARDGDVSGLKLDARQLAAGRKVGRRPYGAVSQERAHLDAVFRRAVAHEPRQHRALLVAQLVHGVVLPELVHRLEHGGGVAARRGGLHEGHDVRRLGVRPPAVERGVLHERALLLRARGSRRGERGGERSRRRQGERAGDERVASSRTRA